MRHAIRPMIAVLVVVGSLAPVAQAQYGRYGGPTSPGGVEQDLFGRSARPGWDNDLTRRPAYPGANTDLMGRPLAPNSDPSRQPLYPGASIDRQGRPLVQDRSSRPTKPGYRKGRPDEEDKDRTFGSSTMPQFRPPVYVPVPSGGGTSGTSAFTRPESRSSIPHVNHSVKISTPKSSGWSSRGGSGGLLVGIGGGLAALAGALFGRRKKTDDPTA